jgi:hypothetical protein
VARPTITAAGLEERKQAALARRQSRLADDQAPQVIGTSSHADDDISAGDLGGGASNTSLGSAGSRPRRPSSRVKEAPRRGSGSSRKKSSSRSRRSPGQGDDDDDSEKNTTLAQKLAQLQPFIAAFPQDCMGQLASFGPT